MTDPLKAILGFVIGGITFSLLMMVFMAIFDKLSTDPVFDNPESQKAIEAGKKSLSIIEWGSGIEDLLVVLGIVLSLATGVILFIIRQNQQAL